MGWKYATKEEAEQAAREKRRNRHYDLDVRVKETEQRRSKLLKRKEWVSNYKGNLGCVDCGEKNPVTLDLDHNGPKSREIADCGSIQEVHSELQDGRCVVRCLNCHRLKTWCESLGLKYDPRINQMVLPERDVKKYIAQYKLKRGCKVCGYNTHHAALDCHHVGPKSINISSITSINRFEHELLFYPFIVLCGNCHRIHHHSERLE